MVIEPLSMRNGHDLQLRKSNQGLDKQKFVNDGFSVPESDVPLVVFMKLCALYNLQACQVGVTAGESGLCCCAGVMSFER